MKLPLSSKYHFWSTSTLCTFLFILLSGYDSFAEGSRNLYPSGAQGYRAYLMSTPKSENWNPFATQGTMWVWVKPGETIYAGSSVQGFTHPGANGQKRGEIVLRSPNGNEYRSLNTNNNPTGGGLIRNRKEELAGPNTGSKPDGYTPFTRVVRADEGGIWEINFISLGENTNIPGGSGSSHPSGTWNGISYDGSRYDGNYPADDQWVQPLSYGANNPVALIAAWDVSVGKAERASETIPGRLFTTVFGGTLPNSRFRNPAFYSKFYVLTPGGYAFQVDNNGQNGASFNFFSNDKGIHVDGKPGIPSYQSLNSSAVAVLSKRTRDPRLPDETSLGSANVTNKLFFDKPAADLPASAPIRYTFDRTSKTTTWLKNPNVVPPTISGVNLACGGTITFNSNVGGGYKVLIDVNNDDRYEDPVDRVLTGQVTAGVPVEILWDGKDGRGADVPGNARIKVKVVVTAGEIHFPFSDVESNWKGIVIGQLSADGHYNQTGNYTVYWDDSNLGSLSATGLSSSPSAPLFNNADGVDSRGNGHKWGGAANEDGESSYFGNNRTIDTWSYVTGSSEAKEIVTCGLSLSGYVFNDVDGLEDEMVDNNNGRDELGLSKNTLHATLLDGDVPVATMPVGQDGQYGFGGLRPNTTYTVVLSTSPNGVEASLPVGWVNTGEFVGTGIGNDGKVDGVLEVPIETTSVANANFGIQYKINIAGNIWHDVNGNAIRNGNEKAVSGGADSNGGSSSLTNGTIFANLVDKSLKVVASVPVNSDGTYAFRDVSGWVEYRVILTTQYEQPGNDLQDSDASIPEGWQATGTNTPSTGARTDNKGNVIHLGIVSTDVANVNFGIQQPPVTEDSYYMLPDSPSSKSVKGLNGLEEASGDKGERALETPIVFDPEYSKLTFVITEPIEVLGGVTPSDGGPVLFYDGRELNDENFPGLVIPDYNPDLLSIQVNGTGYKGVYFFFKVIDEAGAVSNTSRYQIQWLSELPVKWRSINVSGENKQAVLSWATAEESNVAYFEVQYTKDGKSWVPVSTVSAQNQASASYRYIHALENSNMHYFRVKSVDLDGSTSLSSVVSLKGVDGRIASIYPNPVLEGRLNLDFSLTGVNAVKVFMLSGREVAGVRLQGQTLDLKGLASGRYILYVGYADGEVLTKTFIVGH